ncbi:MAG: hypothetical protein D6791_08990, partial [Chloroflexi bacterium]
MPSLGNVASRIPVLHIHVGVLAGCSAGVQSPAGDCALEGHPRATRKIGAVAQAHLDDVRVSREVQRDLQRVGAGIAVVDHDGAGRGIGIVLGYHASRLAGSGLDTLLQLHTLGHCAAGRVDEGDHAGLVSDPIRDQGVG